VIIIKKKKAIDKEKRKEGKDKMRGGRVAENVLQKELGEGGGKG